MGITKLAIKFAAPFPKVQSFNRYLFVGPHPDDSEIGAGATVFVVSEMARGQFLSCFGFALGIPLSFILFGLIAGILAVLFGSKHQSSPNLFSVGR